MNIRIEKLNVEDSDQLHALAKWDCDKDLYPLVTPVFDPVKALDPPSLEGAMKKYRNPAFAKGVYVIFDGESPVGNLSIQIDPPQLLKKMEGTGWLGLLIGERQYWGTGAAAAAMSFFENECRKLGLKRVELGTFEFNLRAQRFYRKLGYQEFARLKEFTYFNGRFWDDIRMEKTL